MKRLIRRFVEWLWSEGVATIVEQNVATELRRRFPRVPQQNSLSSRGNSPRRLPRRLSTSTNPRRCNSRRLR